MLRVCVNISRCAVQQQCVHFVTSLRRVGEASGGGGEDAGFKVSEIPHDEVDQNCLLRRALARCAHRVAGGFAVNGGATVVSDYRFRGISQTNRRFAIQGTVSVSHSSGVYATVWGSSIDDYVAAGADAELDLIIGYKKTFGSTDGRPHSL